MTGASPLAFRALLIYGVCVPLALFLGYLLATPLDYASLTAISIVLAVLCIPLLMKWHHALLITSLNMSAVIFLLPGRPPLWLALAGISLGFGVLQAALNPELRFIRVPAITRPLVILALVIVITMKITGLGLQVFGGGIYGGKRYIFLLGAILVYFALVSRKIPLEKAKLYVALFFLAGATSAIGSLAGAIDARFNFLFLIFPVESLTYLSDDVAVPDDPMGRIGGMPLLSMAFFCAMLAHYGARGLFSFRHSWRLVVLVGFIFLGLLGGFRSTMVTVALTLAVLFYMEGLLNAKVIPALLLGALLGGGLLISFAGHLPLSVQRSLAFLPIDIDPIARMSAQHSSEWRLRMWQELLPQVPQYLIIGKGYAINPNELSLARWEAILRGAGYQESQTAGDYHNGPLSILLPLGIFGFAAFLWFLAVSIRVLYRNHKYSNPALQKINTFLFAFFLARIVFFMAVYGSLYSDMVVFTGMVGLSVSLNGGVGGPATAPVPQESVPEDINPRTGLPKRLAGARRPLEA